jgi:hypothetical protein
MGSDPTHLVPYGGELMAAAGCSARPLAVMRDSRRVANWSAGRC